MEHDPSIDDLPASKVISHSNVIFSEGIAVTIWVDMDFTNKDMEFVQSLPTNQPTIQPANQPTNQLTIQPILLGIISIIYIIYIYNHMQVMRKLLILGISNVKKGGICNGPRGDTYG